MYKFLILLFFIKCSSLAERQKSAIEKVFYENQIYFNQAQEKIKKDSDVISAFYEYTNQLETIDLNQVPKDFGLAFVEHKLAWRTYVKELQEKDKNKGRELLKGLVAVITGNIAQTASSVLSLVNPSEADKSDIHRAWKKMLLVAKKYDVEVKN